VRLNDPPTWNTAHNTLTKTALSSAADSFVFLPQKHKLFSAQLLYYSSEATTFAGQSGREVLTRKYNHSSVAQLVRATDC
jgi:hypothetical protein